MSNSNSWINGLSDSEIKCAQLEDKSLELIINVMENSDHKPTWHEICSENVVVKALWSQWNEATSYTGDGKTTQERKFRGN